MYNKKEIMQNAWSTYRMAQKWVNKLSFSECLRRSWEQAKKAAKVESAIKNHFGAIISGRRVFFDYQVVADWTMGWALTGDTYAIRKEIRSAGFKWDSESKNWYTTDRETIRRFVAKYVA